MGRIRTIKPEFPHSESMGKVSREARLCFLMLFTIVDDAGRARGASRALASLLFPYDDDAKDKIDGWLTELEIAKQIRRYVVDGSTYLDIPKWLEHQKIDHPSKSRLPEFREASGIPREPSRSLAPDLGPRISSIGEGKKRAAPAPKKAAAEKKQEAAKRPLISPEANALADELAVAAGQDLKFIEPGWCGAAMRCQAWLNEGYPRELIVAGVKAMIAAKRPEKIGSVHYFEKGLAKFIATHTRPVPKVERQSAETVQVRHAPSAANRAPAPNSWAAAKDDYRTAFAELAESVKANRARRTDGDGSGEQDVSPPARARLAESARHDGGDGDGIVEIPPAGHGHGD